MTQLRYGPTAGPAPAFLHGADRRPFRLWPVAGQHTPFGGLETLGLEGEGKQDAPGGWRPKAMGGYNLLGFGLPRANASGGL